MRTDLDTFTDVEASALMLSGYLMTEHQLKRLSSEHVKRGETWGGFDIDAPRQEWDFLKIESIMSQAPDSADLRRKDLAKQLEVGSKLVFKVSHLDRKLRIVAWTGLVGALGGVVFAIYQFRQVSIDFGSWSVGSIAISAAVTFLCIAVPAFKWLNPQNAMRGFGLKALGAVVGWLAANIHVKIFDRRFKERGSLERLMNLPAE